MGTSLANEQLTDDTRNSAGDNCLLSAKNAPGKKRRSTNGRMTIQGWADRPVSPELWDFLAFSKLLRFKNPG
jgi:hypothetical protein